MHFWSGVAAVAGALRRRVFIDQFYFRWIPNFYIIFVAPPGVVSKSTTVDTSINLLREVKAIHFGPDIITWQALVTSFADSAEQYIDQDGLYTSESAITCSASELGNLLNPRDRELVDLLVTLWDNRRQLDKVTKLNGRDHIVNPYVNLVGCTTPAWLQENVPPGVVGGGLTSRIVFVYADEKERLVPYPRNEVPVDLYKQRILLSEDLERISTLVGEYVLSPEAEHWGTLWYTGVWKGYRSQEEVFGNYIARKQTHLHKLAMVIAAAKRDELVITAEDLQLADSMLTDTERDMPKVFARLGKSEHAVHINRLIAFIKRRGAVPYQEAWRYVYSTFPEVSSFEDIIAGAIRAGYLSQEQQGDTMMLVANTIVSRND